MRKERGLETDRWEGRSVHTPEALCPVRVCPTQSSLSASVLTLPEKSYKLIFPSLHPPHSVLASFHSTASVSPRHRLGPGPFCFPRSHYSALVLRLEGLSGVGEGKICVGE